MNQQIVAEGQYLAVFNSTHRVLKAEGLLKTKGLQIALIPAPRAVQADCGLAIRFDAPVRNRVMTFLGEQDLLPVFLCQLQAGTFITIQEGFNENH